MSCSTCGNKVARELETVTGVSPSVAMTPPQHCHNCGGFLTQDGVCNNSDCGREAASSLTEYAQEKREAAGKKVIPSGIRKRWQQRVVARGLHEMGKSGAQQYLSDYGRGIGAPKVINLARQAEAEGCSEMAKGFWCKAYELELGHAPPASDDSDGPVAVSIGDLVTVGEPGPDDLWNHSFEGRVVDLKDDGRIATIVDQEDDAWDVDTDCLELPAQSAGDGPVATSAPPPSQALPQVDGLPAHLQPGRISTMQPVDTTKSREDLITDPDYWAQPKRDGRRLEIVATPEQVWYQSRSLNLQAAPSIEIDQTLRSVAKELGPFVLDTELWYPDALGGEHRTGAQAATTNISAGMPHVQPKPRVAIFKALFAASDDITDRPESFRVAAGEWVGSSLVAQATESFEVLPTARTEDEKRQLVAAQQAEGREGEIWVQHSCRYTGGKQSGARPPIVRTKYLTELDVVITDLTPTTAESRPFGAAKVGVYKDGAFVSLGSIGTGFDRQQMAELARRHAETPGQVTVTIATQGFTERGQVMHGRFRGFSEGEPLE